MIIRSRPVANFSVLPNSLLSDKRLSIDTRGMIAYILTKPPTWEIRPVALARALSKNGAKKRDSVGRTRLLRMFKEAQAAGYMLRSEMQSHQEDGAWGSFDYIVGLPEDVVAADLRKSESVASLAQSRDTQTGDTQTGDTQTGDAQTCGAHARNATTSQKERNLVNTDSTKPPVAPIRAEQHGEEGQPWSEAGKVAIAQGFQYVFENSEPFKAWLEFRGADGMPDVVTEIIKGQPRRVVWMPTLYPPRRTASKGDR
jgi:hypothetical protein